MKIPNDIERKVWTHDKILSEIQPWMDNGVSLIDSLVAFSQNNNMEIESVALLIKKSSVMKENLRKEAFILNMLKSDDISK